MSPRNLVLALVYTAAAIVIGLDLAVWRPF